MIETLSNLFLTNQITLDEITQTLKILKNSPQGFVTFPKELHHVADLINIHELQPHPTIH